jgi:hypothetical protein
VNPREEPDIKRYPAGRAIITSTAGVIAPYERYALPDHLGSVDVIAMRNDAVVE